MPRLVATDLDGTALRSDGTVSARTAAAFALIEEAGATLVFVTGRPPRWMRQVSHAVQHRGLAICANGALFYDLHTQRMVESHPIAPEIMTEVVARLRGSVPELAFAVEYEAGYAGEPAFGGNAVDRRAKPDAAAGQAVKLLALHPRLDPEDFHTRVQDLVGDLVTTTYSSGRALVEMSALGVTKATALAVLAERLGIKPAETVAFGDMPNDLPMLAWAGTSYAVANAHPRVLAAADQVIAANDADGVAEMIEKLYR